LIEEKKRTFLQIIKHLKTPTHYVIALHTRVVRDGKLRGLKSHDYHAMMQQVLPFCLHNLMQEETHMSLINLNKVFNKIFAKVIDPNTMQVLRKEVVKTISSINKVFPPTMFDVMTHLVIHLVEESDF